VLGLGFSGHAPLNGSRSKPADVPTPLRSEPPHKRDTGNNKEEIKTESTKPFPKPLPTEQGDTQLARQWVYSEFGERAFAAGQRAVYVGSKPYQAWLSFRGKEGMPGFVDRAIINGKVPEIVWMPSLYPPRRSADESERDGGGQISRGLSVRTGGPGSSAKSSLFFRRKTPLLRLELFSFWTPKRTFGHDRASAKMAIQLVNAPNLVCPILSRYSFVRRAAEGAPILGPIGIGTLTQGRGAPSADPTRHCVAGPGTNLPARA
jgi:hypothetical protein